MRLFQKQMKAVFMLCAMLLLTGCSSSVSLGLTTGVQTGVSIGVSAIVAGLFQALAAPAFGAVGAGN